MTHVETSVRDMNNIVDRNESIGFIQLDESIKNIALFRLFNRVLRTGSTGPME